MDVDFATAVSEQCSSLTATFYIKFKFTRIVNFNNTFVDCSNASAMAGVSAIHCKVITIEVKYGFVTCTTCRNYRTDVAKPRTACNIVIVCGNCGLFLEEVVFASFKVQQTAFNERVFFILVAKDRSVISIFALSVVGHPIYRTLTSYFIILNVAKCFSNRSSSQTFCDSYLTGQVAFAFNHAAFFISTIDVAGVVKFTSKFFKNSFCSFSISCINASIIGN